MEKFDMDMYVKKNQPDRTIIVAVMKKKTAKSQDRYFVVVKRGEFFLTSVFHGIGFWTDELNPNVDLRYVEYEEIWIPYENIDYIKSLTYIRR